VIKMGVSFVRRCWRQGHRPRMMIGVRPHAENRVLECVGIGIFRACSEDAI
jgi:hypothetical protein